MLSPQRFPVARRLASASHSVRLLPRRRKRSKQQAGISSSTCILSADVFLFLVLLAFAPSKRLSLFSTFFSLSLSFLLSSVLENGKWQRVSETGGGRWRKERFPSFTFSFQHVSPSLSRLWNTLWFPACTHPSCSQRSERIPTFLFFFLCLTRSWIYSLESTRSLFSSLFFSCLFFPRTNFNYKYVCSCVYTLSLRLCSAQALGHIVQNSLFNQ